MSEPSIRALPQMTLRQWYAGQALAGLGTWMPHGFTSLNSDAARVARAKSAVAQADAMIAALKETGDA